MSTSPENLLGQFLRARRSSLDPKVCGLHLARRRTPGLRREEVAERANISTKWYTFLEQGRGGAPSVDVLKRLSAALVLTDAEREHLFRLAQPRLKEASREPAASLSPALRRLLDALEFVPAFVKTSAWDIIAWNRAAAATLTDYNALPPDKRNLLRLLFAEGGAKASVVDWEKHARFAVAAFRYETARVGTSDAVATLIEELSASSPDFAAMWSDNEVGVHGEGTKIINHAHAGILTFQYSTFAVDGQADLGLVVFTPATAEDTNQVKKLMSA
jgi:transcriptional regulator with XRE-family HTH domain